MDIQNIITKQRRQPEKQTAPYDFKISATRALNSNYSFTAATPGSTLPSIASRRAPPPVEM